MTIDIVPLIAAMASVFTLGFAIGCVATLIELGKLAEWLKGTKDADTRGK